MALKDWLRGRVKFGLYRSKEWPKVRNEHLLKNPQCAACGSFKSLEVHHIEPFHERPDLELNPDNLITLCEKRLFGVNCHLFFGHLGNWKLKNRRVRTLVSAFKNSLQASGINLDTTEK